MSHKEQVLAHLREAMRSIETAMHSAIEKEDPAQVKRYIQDLAARTSRARAAVDKWEQADG